MKYTRKGPSIMSGVKNKILKRLLIVTTLISLALPLCTPTFAANEPLSTSQPASISSFQLGTTPITKGQDVDSRMQWRLASEVSQFGITWKFDKAYPVGQFVNGDWWVLGPVTVVEVTPGPAPAPPDETTETPPNQWGDTGLQDNNDLRNGSMVVMTPGPTQGYDSRGKTFSADASIVFPYSLEANRSLISSISNVSIPTQVMHYKLMWPSEQESDRVMQTAAVLTSVSKIPPPDAFRPSYFGDDKRIYRARDLRWDRLLQLKFDPADVPSWEQFERYFERPWLDHLNGAWQGQWLLPTQNQPAYGRENARIVGIASLMLHLDVPREQKYKLLVRLVQNGIDLRGIAEQGGYWNEGGGHTSGRKWPILFAGLMLDDKYFFDMPETAIFHEDTQTYYGDGWHGQSALWQMVTHHGDREPYLHKHPDHWEIWDQRSESYRRCCTVRTWGGQSLAALLMGAKHIWNHDAFFDNVDDWMRVEDIYADERNGIPRPPEEGGAFVPWDDFVTDMWARYRSQVPKQRDGGSPRMWDTSQSGPIKWVPNKHKPQSDTD
ncbi:hypothetical protein [Paenibacillus xerothermodurans]|uniref:DUF4962 domain-containing protein n=1 Tax=Paenibacillus xerothermodurans TaxID=1977292 RepID=A0A2W1NX09_PAEXE|nr:hypothetical protein [Paenibacillus xerothermodurans]PZE22256.1 hypothetical protein CBW46_000180 [Paenibacillus xerothermodurans]